MAPKPSPRQTGVDRWRARLPRHDQGMKSKVHPAYKTRHRVGNWRTYERALVRRGEPDAVAFPRHRGRVDSSAVRPAGRAAPVLGCGDRDRPHVASRLPVALAPDGGFVRSILTVMRASLDAPDHTTLSRRSQRLDVAVPTVTGTGPPLPRSTVTEIVQREDSPADPTSMRFEPWPQESARQNNAFRPN